MKKVEKKEKKEKKELTPEARSKRKKILLYTIPVVVIVLVSIALILYARYKPKEKFEIKTPVVQVTRPVRRTIYDSAKFSTYIESNLLAPAVSFVNGKVLSMEKKAGDVVKEDDIIAYIDPELYTYQKDAAAAVATASEETFKRVEELYKTGAVSKQNYDEALAQRDAYKSQLNMADLQLRYTEVKAPKDGIVLTTLSKTGDTVGQGTPVAVVGDLNDLCTYVNVPEKYINEVVPGTQAKITHKDTKEYCMGVVELVEPYINPKSKTFKAKVAIEKTNLKSFVPGASVETELYLHVYENAVCIPRECLNLSDRVYYVSKSPVANNTNPNIAIRPRGGTDTTVVGADPSPSLYVARILENRSFVGDEDYIMVDSKYDGVLFIIRGQNKIYDSQPVLAEGASL